MPATALILAKLKHIAPALLSDLADLLDSSPLVIDDATYTLTQGDAFRPILLARAAGVTLTLPAATGTGDEFEIITFTTVTSNANIIQVANATDVMQGQALFAQDSADTAVMFETASTSDTITGNGTTTGGIKGERTLIKDISSGFFQVNITGSATGTEATPFSAAVS